MRPTSPVPALEFPKTPLLTNYTLAMLIALEAAVCSCFNRRAAAAFGEVRGSDTEDVGNGAEGLEGVAERYGLQMGVG